jgi:hypothetical protein
MLIAHHHRVLPSLNRTPQLCVTAFEMHDVHYTVIGDWLVYGLLVWALDADVIFLSRVWLPADQANW